MAKLGTRYLWFKLALVMGSLLGVVLLVQSTITYYQVSRILVLAELRREAQRQVNLVARDTSRSDFQDSTKLQSVLDELRLEAPSRIAWVRLVDASGKTLAQSGRAVGGSGNPRYQPASDEAGPPPSDVRVTEQGKVLVVVLPMRGRGPSVEMGFRPPDRGGTNAVLPAGAPSQQGRRPNRPLVEIALYLASASAAFGQLLTNLVISSSAALGLVASMLLIWARFPNYVRGKQLEQQTELARKVQTDLLPSSTLAIANLDFAAECVPAWQVGGDFYDVFSTPEGRIAIVLGDVSGKGLPASVVAGLLLGAIRSSDWLEGSSQHEHASRQLSELLRTRTSIERFASLFWCYYEPATRSLSYVNAGHLPPMVVSRNGHGPATVERLEEGGPVLGVISSASYHQGTSAVVEGGVLVLYSDGVVEASNSADDQFGEDRLRAILCENAGRPSAEIRDEILRQVRLFLGKESAQDDLTLVVARLQSK